ncbi:MAG: hypothetical protein U0794_10830 [Isosphaeraceae bacterium]
MNSPSFDPHCERCHELLNQDVFILQVDDELAHADLVELRICATCRDSLERWMRRRGHQPSSRSKRRPRRTVYTADLDRSARWQERWLRLEWILPALIILICAGAVAAGVLARAYLRR